MYGAQHGDSPNSHVGSVDNGVDGVAMNEKFEGDNTSTSASVVSHAFHRTANCSTGATASLAGGRAAGSTRLAWCPRQ